MASSQIGDMIKTQNPNIIKNTRFKEMQRMVTLTFNY